MMANLSAQVECDCPEIDWESEGICVEIIDVEFDSTSYVAWVPSECFAACWFEDFTVADCEDDWGWEDDWEWEDECECPEDDWNTEGICVEVIDLEYDSIAYTTWVPSECYAACWYGDYTIADCEDNWGWEDECDCPEEDWNSEGICVEVLDLEYDSTAYTTWAPSECYAACWYGEYTVVDCEDNWGWEDECDCPEEDLYEEGICVEVIDIEFDSLAYTTWAPSECYAACWYGEYTVVDCEDNWGWEDECDCPEEDWNSEGICIEVIESELDTFGYISWAPSECYAACWYDTYTVVECEEWDDSQGGGLCDWELDCECELDSDEGICIAYVYEMDTLVEWVPNECFADCWGFENYAVVDCEDFWDWEEEDGGIEIEVYGDAECVLAILEEEITTFQAFLIGLHECEAIELDACVLGAPTFDTDEEFIDYLVANCPDWFGFIMDESEGPSLFKQFGETQSNGTTSTNNIIESLEVKLLGNPVYDQLDVQINATDALNLKMALRTVNGTTVKTDIITLNKGTQVYSVNTAELTGGTYLMTMVSEEGTQTIKFVVVK